MIDYDVMTLYDACTDTIDMIGTGRILDADPPEPRSTFDMFRISMLEIDDDNGIVATDNIHLFMLRERPTLCTHLFLLTPCSGLSPVLMIFLMVIMT